MQHPMSTTKTTTLKTNNIQNSETPKTAKNSETPTTRKEETGKLIDYLMNLLNAPMIRLQSQ